MNQTLVSTDSDNDEEEGIHLSTVFAKFFDLEKENSSVNLGEEWNSCTECDLFDDNLFNLHLERLKKAEDEKDDLEL